MKKIPVRLKNAAYDVTLGEISLAGEVFDLDRRVLIVSDDGVPEAPIAAVAAACRKAEIFRFPQGEKSKNLTTYGGILSAALTAGLTRKDALVAVGGGVTGDLTGFAAATYLRGVDFYNVPTTLLSQVDSSVGGKTGVDFDGVKNAVGAFWQPRGVLIAPGVLATLSRRQFRAGLAEIVKIAAACDAALFEELERLQLPWGADAPGDAPVGGELPAALPGIIARAVERKRDVVEKDPTEAGLRRVLNFGHTLGHGIESAAGLHGLLHGECVALGMLPMCAPEVRARLLPVLTRLGLPTTLPTDPERVLAAVCHDKKCDGQQVAYVYVPRVGEYEIRHDTVADFCNRVRPALEEMRKGAGR